VSSSPISRAIFSVSTQTRFKESSTPPDQFGEQRLVEALRQFRELPTSALLASVADEIRQFSPQEQTDDITLIVAKRK
jgi:serine phosphatase RsbU (regulator of sigma subunit)